MAITLTGQSVVSDPSDSGSAIITYTRSDQPGVSQQLIVPITGNVTLDTPEIRAAITSLANDINELAALNTAIDGGTIS
jgi:putative N-acetylmannosamine-6-phosphate epimerase